MSIRIVADSTCDLPAEVIKELSITVVPLFINVGDEGYLDGVDITRQEFYNRLPDFPEHPSTGTPGPNAFQTAYSNLQKDGASEIISIHISESLSATIQVARQAAEEFDGIPVHVVDSQQLSTGTGFQVELAARMAQKGKSSQEILAALDSLASRTFVAAALDTLEFLRRSGRMNGVVTGLGTLLQLKPILTMREGKPDSVRVRTTSKAKEQMTEMLSEFAPVERFSLLHTNASAQAKEFGESLKSIIGDVSMEPLDITPVIGAHVGPGAIGFAVVKKEQK